MDDLFGPDPFDDADEPYFRLMSRIRQLEETFRHTHVGPDRTCKECNLDLTDDVHTRAQP